jgi:Domain of unknown function (DUF4292)
MARVSYGVLSLCGVLLLCVGCRGILSPHSTPTAAAPLLTTAEPFWQHLALRRQTFQTLKGLAQAQLYTPTQNLAVDSVAVVWQHFAALRLEGIGSLGQPLFLLITDGQNFSYYAPQEARLVSGTASASNMERVFGITLAPNALQYMLIGDIPLDSVPMGGKVVYLPKPDLYMWEGQIPQQSGHYRIWFAASHRQPVRFEVEDILGRLVLRVQYENFRQLQDFTMPYHITVDQPLADQRVIWRYSDVRINAEVLPALFHMRVPAGVERVELK